MSTVTDLRFWRDPGYTEGCIEVPPSSDALPTPSVIISDDLNISVADLFSTIKLKEPYESLYDCCYLRITFDMNNGNDVTFYGWIDSVAVQSDTTDYPITVVRWHVDYWRTYLSSAEFGSGMVKRRPLNGTEPPQSHPHRYTTASEVAILDGGINTDVWWVFVRRNSMSNQNAISRWYVWPVSKVYHSTRLAISASMSNLCPSLDECAGGQWDELLGFDPEEVVYAFVSPVPPCSYTGNGRTSPINLSASSNGWGLVNIGSLQCFFNDYADMCEEVYSTFTVSRMSSDITTYIVTGFDGEPVGALPWGLTVTGYGARVIPTATSGAIEIRMFMSGQAQDMDTVTNNANGMTYAIPCPAIDLSSNSWSSYVYSGNRQAEMEMRRLNTESQAETSSISANTSTVTGGLTGAAGGALMGATVGSVIPGAGTLIGAGIGAVIGGLSGVVSGIGQQHNASAIEDYQSNVLNDQIQAVSDYQMSNQASTQLLLGSGFDFVNMGFDGPRLMQLSWDTYSVTQRANDISIYGVSVSEPMSSCQSLVNAGGPLQIQNLVVRGDIPSGAKQYFRDRFAKGVRIV